ncbi:MAG TPA: hemolysin family protein [Candidatus Brocadiia bacterium]|nr:hemolysin family protein [Candidatus Brocadiia bacterium]
MPETYEVALIAALLLISGFFSCSETALFSLSRYRVKKLRKEKRGGVDKVAALLKNPINLLVTILLGNMFVNVAASTISERMMVRILGPAGLGVSVVMMTFLLLVFGEVTPKALAVVISERAALFAAPILTAFGRVISPLRLALLKTSDFLLSTVTPMIPSPRGLSTAELRTAIAMGQEQGELDADERTMMNNVLSVGGKTVKDVLIPRERIFAIDASGDMEAQRRRIKKLKYSRIPVCDGSLDNMLGILHVKDALLWVRGFQADFDIRENLRRADIVRESMPLVMLLRRFQRTKSLMSIVTDDGGRLVGLVTLQDILDEMLAGLGREDGSAQKIRRLENGDLIAQSDVTVEALRRHVGIVLNAPPRNSLANILEDVLDREPEYGDEVALGDYVLRVHAPVYGIPDAIQISHRPQNDGEGME